MAGKKKDDDWSDSDDDTAKPSGKSSQSSAGDKKGGKKGPQQLEFMNISEIQKVISKNDALSDAVDELLENLAKYMRTYGFY